VLLGAVFIEHVYFRVSWLQGEAENVKQSAEESRQKAATQSEQLLVVMTTLKDEHSKVSSMSLWHDLQ